jgi:hypothetical protein
VPPDRGCVAPQRPAPVMTADQEARIKADLKRELERRLAEMRLS